MAPVISINKIALEEHFLDPGEQRYFETVSGGRDLFQSTPALRFVVDKLSDVDALRIADMDALGIKIAILSYYNGSSVQLDQDVGRAVVTAQRMNDFLARRIDAHPARFLGWAALPLQNVAASVAELRRCVSTLGFKGAMVNGTTFGCFLDNPCYLPLWETLADLDVPLFLHPGAGSAQPSEFYDGYFGFGGPGWGWSVETGLHALRIIHSGIFDRFPSLNLVLGHMGELLPFHLNRFDQVWHSPINTMKTDRPPSHYVRNNILIATSGNVSAVTLIGANMAIGADRVLFATDYPLANGSEYVAAIEGAGLSQSDRDKIYFENAQRIFRL